MKNKLLLFVATGLMLSCFQLGAQNDVQYKVTRDDPNDICNFWMFLDPFQMDAPLKNIDGFSFNTGIAGIGLVQKRFGFDYGFRIGTLTFGKLMSAEAKRAMQIEAGGLFTLSDRTATRSNTKIVLSVTESTNANGDRIETTKFIRIPALRRTIIHARGGLYYKRNPFGRPDEELGSDIEGNLTSVGVYLGISRMGVSNVFLNTNTDGKASRSGILRFYADVIFCPVRKFEPYGQSSAVPASFKVSGPLGFRIGFYGMPCEDRATKKKKALMAVGGEVGIRPGDGIYCTGSFMFTLVRRKAKVFGYVRPAGVNEKGQEIEKE
ncbi:MAG TPA: hypothetical protein VK826_09975 [Bacteroidia bacterium]|nr:hypothetical protein [Bacteroidia bacterium]